MEISDKIDDKHNFKVAGDLTAFILFVGHEREYVKLGIFLTLM